MTYRWRDPSLRRALELKKGLQQRAAFGFENAANRELDVMIHAGKFVQVGRSTEAAHLRVGDGVADATYPRHQHGPGAHGAGFLCDVDGGSGQAPVAEFRSGLGEGEHFGVGGGIFRALDGVVG